MIEAKARNYMGFAHHMYERNNDTEMVDVTFQNDNFTASCALSIPQVKELIEQLQSIVHDFNAD